jgi:hypothetical protein
MTFQGARPGGNSTRGMVPRCAGSALSRTSSGALPDLFLGGLIDANDWP